MMNFRKTVAVLFVICALIMSCNAVIAEDQVSFLLPINYFCVDDDQTVSTQQQLDEHSKDGLMYEFTADGQIRCTVTDQAAALQAVILDMENTFAEAQDPNGAMYAKSFRKLESMNSRNLFEQNTQSDIMNRVFSPSKHYDV